MTIESEIRFCVLSSFSSQHKHDGGIVVCLGVRHTESQLSQGGAVCVQGGGHHGHGGGDQAAGPGGGSQHHVRVVSYIACELFTFTE